MYYCDFSLSIGKHCRPAIELRLNGLRFFSAPLDWIGGYTLDVLLDLYKTNFKTFFEKYEINYEEQATEDTIWVGDPVNNLFSVHHFKKDKDIAESYKEFMTAMRRRADRLEHYLEVAHDIVLVAERDESKEELMDFLKSFSDLYPHLNIRLFNVRHDINMESVSYKEVMYMDNGKLSYLEYTFNDTKRGEETVSGNRPVWKKVLKGYKLRPFEN